MNSETSLFSKNTQDPCCNVLNQILHFAILSLINLFLYIQFLKIKMVIWIFLSTCQKCKGKTQQTMKGKQDPVTSNREGMRGKVNKTNQHKTASWGQEEGSMGLGAEELVRGFWKESDSDKYWRPSWLTFFLVKLAYPSTIISHEAHLY